MVCSMGAKSKVIAGDYNGSFVVGGIGVPSIGIPFGKAMALDKSTVEAYEVITEEEAKSAGSGVVVGWSAVFYWVVLDCLPVG